MPLDDAEPAARSRRITRRGVARRAQILEVATRMFLERGYAGAGIDEIVKAVGGSKTNVYSQFGGKEGLFAAVVEDLCENFLHDVLVLDLSDTDARHGLTLIGNTLLGILLQERHIAFQRLVTAESGRHPALAGVWFKAGPQHTRQFIAEFIDARQRAGELRGGDATLAASLFHSMLVFNPVLLAMLGTTPSLDATRKHVDVVVDLFLAGMEEPVARTTDRR